MPGEARVCAEEAFGRHARALAAKRGKRSAARLAHTARLRRVRDDAEEPGLERGTALEAVDPVENGEPRLLDDLLGHGPARHVHAGDPQHPGSVHPRQRGECSLVTRTQAVDKLRVLTREHMLHRATVTGWQRLSLRRDPRWSSAVRSRNRLV